MTSRAEFLRSAAAVGLLASTSMLVANRAEAAPARPGLTYRGVTYDTGTVFLGATTRPWWTRSTLAHDLRAIDERLHCNAITVFGTGCGGGTAPR